MTTKNMIRIITLSMGLLAAVPVMGFAQGSQAPTAPTPSARVDGRWTPYLGCWRLYQENVRSSNVPVPDAMMVCVSPSKTNAGVTMITYVASRPVLTQDIVADGQSHPVTEADCQGTQTNAWSRDGERLFTHVEVACNGRPTRIASGLTLMTQGATWVDVQATDNADDSQVRIRRYQRTIERPADMAALPADLVARAMADTQSVSAATMNVEDVIEASKQISPAALEAALDETNARFNLNSRVLKQLADARVDPNVIDLMVAQSYPSQFHVDRRPTFAPQAPYASSVGSVGGTTMIYSGGAGSMMYPYYDPYYSYYSYYSPFAYPYWGTGYYLNNYYYTPRRYFGSGAPIGYGFPGGGGGIYGGGTAIATPETPGQVVNGRGYTRVSPGSPSTAGSGAQESAPASHTTSSPRGVRGSSGGDSGSVSSGGYSSGSASAPSGGSSSAPSGGGGGDSGGRTAQPR